MLFLQGGSDSWNLLVPHTGCVPGNTTTNYEQYARIRGGVALPFADLLPVSARVGTQAHSVCSTYGVHPQLPILKALYDDSQAAFLANVGTLVEPMTKAEYMDKSKRRPPSLFAHNTQVKVTQSVHAQDNLAKGVLGRIVEALESPGGSSAVDAAPPPSPPSPPYKTGAYSLAGIAKILDGDSPPNILNKDGVVRYTQNAKLGAAVAAINEKTLDSVFAETFATSLTGSIESAERLGDELAKVSLATSFPTHALGESFEQVAKVVKAHDALGEERQIFYVELGGFDTHNSLQETVATKFTQIDGALTSFVAEMKAQGLWDQVALVSSSDFARTLGSNGAGTDRAAQSRSEPFAARRPNPPHSRLVVSGGCVGARRRLGVTDECMRACLCARAYPARRCLGRQLLPHRRRCAGRPDPGPVSRLLPRDGERQHRTQPPPAPHLTVGGCVGGAC